MHPDRTGQGLGSAGLEPAAPLTAGAKVRISVRYAVGERGLSWTGGLRLTVPYGLSPPQFTCVTDDGYLTAVIETPGREGVKMEFFLPHSVIGEIHNEYMTRWGRFVFLRPVGGDLTRGDVVRIDYGRDPFYPQVMARAPLFAGRFHFDVAVGPRTEAPADLTSGGTAEVELRLQ